MAGACSVEGCPYTGQLWRGMCQKHYRYLKLSDPTRLRCAVTDCDRVQSSKGFCERHYNRFRLYGDPEAPPKEREYQERISMANGYILLRLGPGERDYEHRVVWREAHGEIPDGFHVHHKNHDRTDNRLENLKLVDGRQHNREHTLERHRNGSLRNHGPHSGRWRDDLDNAEIVQRRDSGESFRGIAESMDVSHGVVAHHYRVFKEVMS